MGQSPPGSTYNEQGEGLPFFQGRSDFGFRYPDNRKFCTAPTRIALPGDSLVSVRAPVGDINIRMGKMLYWSRMWQRLGTSQERCHSATIPRGRFSRHSEKVRADRDSVWCDQQEPIWKRLPVIDPTRALSMHLIHVLGPWMRESGPTLQNPAPLLPCATRCCPSWCRGDCG